MNRSDAVCLGLEELIDRQARLQIGMHICNSYHHQPQIQSELTGLEEATRALIEKKSLGNQTFTRQNIVG